jgi:hypothetical protein
VGLGGLGKALAVSLCGGFSRVVMTIHARMQMKNYGQESFDFRTSLAVSH